MRFVEVEMEVMAEVVALEIMDVRTPVLGGVSVENGELNERPVLSRLGVDACVVVLKNGDG